MEWGISFVPPGVPFYLAPGHREELGFTERFTEGNVQKGGQSTGEFRIHYPVHLSGIGEGMWERRKGRRSNLRWVRPPLENPPGKRHRPRCQCTDSARARCFTGEGSMRRCDRGMGRHTTSGGHGNEHGEWKPDRGTRGGRKRNGDGEGEGSRRDWFGVFVPAGKGGWAHVVRWRRYAREGRVVGEEALGAAHVGGQAHPARHWR